MIVTAADLTRWDPLLLRSVLDLAARGWHVFPCAPGGKRPALRGNWQKLATVDPDRVRAWWTRAAYNIGVACGPSRLLVIDLDIPRRRTPGEPGACLGGVWRRRARSLVRPTRAALSSADLRGGHPVGRVPSVLRRLGQAGAELRRPTRPAHRRTR